MTISLDANSRVKVLQQVLCICYLVQFKQELIQVLLNLGSKVNAIIPVYVAKLNLTIQKIDINAQKIDGSTLATYKMVIVRLSVYDKFEKV